MRLFLTVFCGFLGLMSISGQNPPIQIILPNQYDEKNRTKSIEDDIQFFVYPLGSTATIPLTEFKKRHPTLVAPDSLAIVPPTGEAEQPTHAMIGLIPDANRTVGGLIIWLVANYGEEQISVWLDKDNDRDYTTDTEYVWLSSGNKPYEVTIRSAEGVFRPQQLTVVVPAPVAATREQIRTVGKIMNQFSVGIRGTLGQGDLTYDYANLVTGFPSGYTVSYTEKGLGLNVDYNFRYVRVGLAADYLSSTYYTSVLTNQLDEPELQRDPNTGREFLVYKDQVLRNQDDHANRRLQLGGVVAGRIHITPGMEVQPFASLGLINYLPGKYSIRENREDLDYAYGLTRYTEVGLRFDFAVGTRRQLFVEGGLQRIDWRPEGFFERIPNAQLRIENQYVRLSLGYRTALF